MAVETVDYLYRIRVQFKQDGTLDLVEVVHRRDIVEGDKVVASAGELAFNVSTEPLHSAIAELRQQIEAVAADDKAKGIADAARRKAEFAHDEARKQESNANALANARARTDAAVERVKTNTPQ